MFHVIISGDVQGVGFRQFTKYQANKLGVKGWVKNLPDGRVEAILQGRTEDVEKLILLCRKGPAVAIVRDLKVEELPDQEFEGFDIIKE